MPIVNPGRPYAQRLRKDLDEVRNELLETVTSLMPDELDWVPRENVEMKSYKQILQEIGTMEKLTLHMAQHGEELDWGTIQQSLDKNDLRSLLEELGAIRAQTLAFLEICTEEQLQTPVPLSLEWQGYLHMPVVEPEELLRWIVRHEYYHVGQLVIYGWQRGKYDTSSTEG